MTQNLGTVSQSHHNACVVACTVTFLLHSRLQYHGGDDEEEHEAVEGVLVRPRLQEVLQLRYVLGEQRHVHQPMRNRLLPRIAVPVEVNLLNIQ